MKLASILLACALAAPAFAEGRIVLVHDDWTTSNAGFAQAPTTAQFALNVADWFSPGVHGNFLVYSQSFALVDTKLAQTMTGAGHTWTVSVATPFSLALAQQYDAVFLGGFPVNTAVLTQYVQGGGDVYLFGGTGSDSVWNPFLANFGFKFDPLNNVSGLLSITSPHPLFSGVTSLYQVNGSTIVDLEPANGKNQLLVSQGGVGLFAVYDGTLPTIYCTAKTNSQGCVPAIGYSGSPSATSLAHFDVNAVNVLNKKNGILFYGHSPLGMAFQGGTLCVASPTRLTPIQNAKGSPGASDCSGAYSLDMNAWIRSGVDPQLFVGQHVYAQYWTRDPLSPSTTGLTDAIHFVIGA
ncbi:MAG: hypothetical protein K8S98_15980 [Planctomycetes bacterium]|nr:hypothetical protein [Planctomycetota bacterium]